MNNDENRKYEPLKDILLTEEEKSRITARTLAGAKRPTPRRGLRAAALAAAVLLITAAITAGAFYAARPQESSSAPDPAASAQETSPSADESEIFSVSLAGTDVPLVRLNATVGRNAKSCRTSEENKACLELFTRWSLALARYDAAGFYPLFFPQDVEAVYAPRYMKTAQDDFDALFNALINRVSAESSLMFGWKEYELDAEITGYTAFTGSEAAKFAAKGGSTPDEARVFVISASWTVNSHFRSERESTEFVCVRYGEKWYPAPSMFDEELAAILAETSENERHEAKYVYFGVVTDVGDGYIELDGQKGFVSRGFCTDGKADIAVGEMAKVVYYTRERHIAFAGKGEKLSVNTAASIKACCTVDESDITTECELAHDRGESEWERKTLSGSGSAYAESLFGGEYEPAESGSDAANGGEDSPKPIFVIFTKKLHESDGDYIIGCGTGTFSVYADDSAVCLSSSAASECEYIRLPEGTYEKLLSVLENDR